MRLRGCTCNANCMKSSEYTQSTPVIFPLICSGGFFMSARPYSIAQSYIYVHTCQMQRSILPFPPSFLSQKGNHHCSPSLRACVSLSLSFSCTYVCVCVCVCFHDTCIRTAITKPQFATGPQKCVVVGPVGELINVLAIDIIDMVVAPQTPPRERVMDAACSDIFERGTRHTHTWACV